MNIGGVWKGLSLRDSLFGPSIGAGEYEVIYEFGGTCGDTDTVSITVTGQLDASILTADTMICEGTGGFELRKTTLGGVWTNTPDSIFDYTALSPGDYKVYYEFGGSCGDTDSVTITVSSTPKAENIDTTICENSLVINLPGSDNYGPGVTAGVFDPATAGVGTHNIFIIEGTTCKDTSLSEIKIIENHTNPTFSFDTTLCSSNSEFALPISNGEWTGEGVTDNKFDLNKDVGVYNIEFTNKEECGINSSAVINIVGTKATLPDISNLTPCIGDTITIKFNDSFDRDWRFDGLRFSGDSIQYIVTEGRELTGTIVTDYGIGCVDTFKIPLIQPSLSPEIDVDFSNNPEQLTEFSQELIITSYTLDAANYWTINDSTTRGSYVTFLPSENDSLSFCLETTNTNGCSSKYCEKYQIKKVNDFYIPSAFTPNNDGTNDEFKVEARYFPMEFEMYIFDRWGDLVYVLNSINDTWDGTDMNSGLPLGIDTYVYKIEYTFIGNRDRIKVGQINLIR